MDVSSVVSITSKEQGWKCRTIQRIENLTEVLRATKPLIHEIKSVFFDVVITIGFALWLLAYLSKK